MSGNQFLVFLVEIHFVCTNMFCWGNEIDSIVAYVNVYEFRKIESRHFNRLKFNRNRTNMFTNNNFHTNTMSPSPSLSLSLSHTHTHSFSLSHTHTLYFFSLSLSHTHIHNISLALSLALSIRFPAKIDTIKNTVNQRTVNQVHIKNKWGWLIRVWLLKLRGVRTS